MKCKTMQEAIWAIDSHIAKNPMDKTELPNIRAFLADYASKRSSIIGDLKNKLIASQQEVIELRKAFANNQNQIQMLKKARCKKTWDCKEFDCLYKNE